MLLTFNYKQIYHVFISTRKRYQDLPRIIHQIQIQTYIHSRFAWKSCKYMSIERAFNVTRQRCKSYEEQLQIPRLYSKLSKDHMCGKIMVSRNSLELNTGLNAYQPVIPWPAGRQTTIKDFKQTREMNMITRVKSVQHQGQPHKFESRSLQR